VADVTRVDTQHVAAAAASDLGDGSLMSGHRSSWSSAERSALIIVVALAMLAVVLTPRVRFPRRAGGD
jgi:hypothetical protein